MKFELSHFPVSTAALAAGAGVQPALDPGLSIPPISDEQMTSAPPRDGDGISVCHLSPVKGRLDARTYNMEILPAVKHGVRAALVGPHGTEHHENGLDVVPLTGGRSRLNRFFTSPAIAFFARRQSARIYHLHNPEMIPAGLLLKLLFRKTVVYDTQEDFAAMMLTKTYLPPGLRGLMGKAVHIAERLAANIFDGFMTADPGTMRSLAHSGKSKKLVFYNLPNLEFFTYLKPMPKRFDVVYRGGLSERAGTFVLLEALQILRRRGILARALLFGYTDDQAVRSSILERVNRMNLTSQVFLHGRVPHAEMADTLSQARISISPLMAIPKFMNNIPVKVFESWACGLPVISSDLPPIRPFFRDGEFGLLFPPGDSRALADAIEDLLKNPSRADLMGRAGRRAVFERCNNKREIHKLISFYAKVLNGKSRASGARPD
ncbi:MAG TPA: glycosyltransferase family 4 protein [Candidatus Acidoferrum sp.]|nr:glycosyltransferase family 4 protein [Candidatus Acidoferrum sp.]